MERCQKLLCDLRSVADHCSHHQSVCSRVSELSVTDEFPKLDDASCRRQTIAGQEMPLQAVKQPEDIFMSDQQAIGILQCFPECFAVCRRNIHIERILDLFCRSQPFFSLDGKSGEDQALFQLGDPQFKFVPFDIRTDNVGLKIIILKRPVCDPDEIGQIRVNPVDLLFGDDTAFLILDLFFMFKQVKCHFCSFVTATWL